MSKKKVALMCGHGRSVDGSWDPGCAYSKYTEAGLMLAITKAAVKYLRSYGVTVISDADTNNNKNMIADVRWANSEGTDIYVSVHCDYSLAPSGVMPLYTSKKGRELATCLNKAVKNSMGMRSRGVVKRNDLWELNGTDMVACILETGAIKADLNILKNKPDSYGKAIAKGICDYLGVNTNKVVKVKPAKTETKAEAKTLYRVRHSWNEPATQVGAFYDLENAKQSADVNGLNVYGPNGKLVYSAKKKVAETPKPAVKTETWVDKANAWALETAQKKFHYLRWKESDIDTHTCPICKKRKFDDHYGWNCIGWAFAIWRHGGGLKSKCNCHVVADAKRILEAKTERAAYDEAMKRIGISNIQVIRNHGKSIRHMLKAGDICWTMSGGKIQHTYYYMGNGKYSDSTSGRSDNIKAGMKASSSLLNKTVLAVRVISEKEAKVLNACMDEAKWEEHAEYDWQKNPTAEKAKKKATCVTYGSRVLQRLGALKSGQALWHNGKGYGTGKVTGATDKTDVKYMDNKTLASLKSKLKAGDMILLDDNKSGKKGSGGHEFILTGIWDGDDPVIWDMEPKRVCMTTQKPRKYNGQRKVLARVRVKG